MRQSETNTHPTDQIQGIICMLIRAFDWLLKVGSGTRPLAHLIGRPLRRHKSLSLTLNQRELCQAAEIKQFIGSLHDSDHAFVMFEGFQ